MAASAPSFWSWGPSNGIFDWKGPALGTWESPTLGPYSQDPHSTDVVPEWEQWAVSTEQTLPSIHWAHFQDQVIFSKLVPGVSGGLILQQQLLVLFWELQVQFMGVYIQIMDVPLDFAAGLMGRDGLRCCVMSWTGPLVLSWPADEDRTAPNSW